MKVFISHFSGDSWIARQMANAIEGIGATTFLDVVDIESGDPFEESIRRELDAADEILVLLTPEAMDRPYVWMEIGAAWVQRKRIVGVLYRVTTGELATQNRTPALIKSILLRSLNEFDQYLDELRERIQEQ